VWLGAVGLFAALAVVYIIRLLTAAGAADPYDD
jgi:hypothetical protein